ncbi:MAG: hypothetical protein ABI134_24745 [Byssovorax sp.]
MMKAKLAVPNAILFILDPTNEAAIVPEYVPGEAAAATPSCVSVATIADVDGEVTVRLCATLDDVERTMSAQVFHGSVETPGHVLAVVTSDFERVLEIATPSLVTRITIRVDDVQSTAEVSVDVNPYPDLAERSG